jgi:hypothetical protein
MAARHSLINRGKFTVLREFRVSALLADNAAQVATLPAPTRITSCSGTSIRLSRPAFPPVYSVRQTRKGHVPAGTAADWTAKGAADFRADAIINRVRSALFTLLSLLLAFSGIRQAAGGDDQAPPGAGSFDGQWIADVPVQGTCPASHMTLFVHGRAIDGSVFNPAGTFAITGEVDKTGQGQIKIGDFVSHIKFLEDHFAADYFNACGERQAIGKRLDLGQRS